MATTTAPVHGPFETALREDGRFGDLNRSHFEPERRQSGNLPDQPAGNEVDAAPGNATPWSGMRSGR